MEVLAAEAPRTYLVLAQNNAELRATGGIPTAWATLTVDTGKISMSTFGDPPRNVCSARMKPRAY